MPNHSFLPIRGRIENIQIESEALSNNLLGDPSSRTVAIYLPENYDKSGDEYPLFLCLAGFHRERLGANWLESFSGNPPPKDRAPDF